MCCHVLPPATPKVSSPLGGQEPAHTPTQEAYPYLGVRGALPPEWRFEDTAETEGDKNPSPLLPQMFWFKTPITQTRTGTCETELDNPQGRSWWSV